MFFIMSSLFLSKTGIGLKLLFFDHIVRYGSSVTFKIGVASESLQNLDNHEPQRFYFYHQLKTMNIHKRTFILVIGAFLKFFCIFSHGANIT